MLKLKKGNVFEKLNNMTRKQAYTYGGIAIALVVVFFLIASFLGNAEDPSFEGFTSRGYDLATSPFMTDAAEEYLLASKYQDMQEQPSNFLYSQEEKEARQEQEADFVPDEVNTDGENETENPFTDGNSSSSAGSSSSGSRGYGGYGGGRGTKTEINSIGSFGQRAQAGGTGANNSYSGGMQLDTRAFKENKHDMTDSKPQTQQKPDAKRALSQFSQGAYAAAGLKNNRDLNFKRALMGGGKEAGAFTADGAIDLSKVDASQLDTNAPQTETPDLSTLKDDVSSNVSNSKNNNNHKNKNKFDWTAFWTDLLKSVVTNVGEPLLKEYVGGLREKNQQNAYADSLYAMALTGDNAAREKISECGGVINSQSSNDQEKKYIRDVMRNCNK